MIDSSPVLIIFSEADYETFEKAGSLPRSLDAIQREMLENLCNQLHCEWREWERSKNRTELALIKAEMKKIQRHIDSNLEFYRARQSKNGNLAFNAAAREFRFYYSELRNNPRADFSHLIGDLELQQKAVTAALKNIRGPAGSGPVPSLLNHAIAILAAFYKDVGGTISASNDRETGRPNSPFIRFACAIFNRLPAEMVTKPKKYAALPDLVQRWVLEAKARKFETKNFQLKPL
jgi:hypothetical protein